MRIDLHIHSTASDGSLPPEDVAERARAVGLDVIAVADHDTTAGVLPATIAAAEHVVVIPALEVTAAHLDRDLHILGYFVDPADPDLVAYTDRAREGRELRVRAMLERLAELDVAVEFDAVREEAVGARSLARPHLARALLAAGHVGSVSEAFDRFIGDDAPAFVPTRLIEPAAAIDMIHAAGGMAVWAHPPLPLLGGALRELVEAGLDGMECFRPRLNEADTSRLLNKARQHGLMVTGGSDWHGSWQGDLGAFHLRRDQVAEFLERGGV